MSMGEFSKNGDRPRESVCENCLDHENAVGAELSRLRAERSALITANIEVAQHNAKVESERDVLKAEVERLKGLCDRSLTYCAYCGAEFICDTDAAKVSAHIATCEKHPMRDVEKQRDVLRAEVESLKKRIGQLEHYEDLLTATRHRDAALEEAAKVCDENARVMRENYGNSPDHEAYARCLGQATCHEADAFCIRALKKGGA